MRHGLRFDLGTALLTEYDDDGFIGLQIDAFGEEDSGMPPFELHHPYGFASRPQDPDEDGTGCGVLYALGGNEGHAWLAGDPRVTPKLPPLGKGASLQYSSAGAWNLLEGAEGEENGSYQLYVPFDLDADGVPQKAHTIRVDTEENAITILHANGQAIVLGSDGGVTIAADDKTAITMTPGKITLTAAEVLVNGTLVIADATTAATATTPAMLVTPQGAPYARLKISAT